MSNWLQHDYCSSWSPGYEKTMPAMESLKAYFILPVFLHEIIFRKLKNIYKKLNINMYLILFCISYDDLYNSLSYK